MPLIKSCTSEVLYSHLKELGVNTKELRKKKAPFAELKELYLDLMNERLAARSKRIYKMAFS